MKGTPPSSGIALVGNMVSYETGQGQEGVEPPRSDGSTGLDVWAHLSPSPTVPKTECRVDVTPNPLSRRRARP